MSIQNKGNWTYEYTDDHNNRFYKLYDRQNKQLCVLNLRQYNDEYNDHINWEMWKSPSFCVDEDHAEGLLEYYDSGIYGSGFVSCLVDAVDKPRTLMMPSHWEESPYKLHKDQEFA
jgi:hypothetical protein